MTEAAPERRQLEMQLRLAEVYARPDIFVHEARLAEEPLDGAAVRRFSANPAFRPAFSAWLGQRLQLARFAAAPAALEALGRSAHARLAVMILTAAESTLARLATELAALVLARRIVGAVLKTERETLRASFGAEALEAATQQAALLYPRLTELDAMPLKAPLPLLLPGRAEVVDFGMLAFEKLIAGFDKGLGALFALRSPPERISAAFVQAPEEAHAEAILRFVQRKEPAWRSIIA